MEKNVQFFGIVKNGRLKIFAPQHLEGKYMRLTVVREQEAKSPGSGEIDLSNYEDKIIEASGQESGEWIYSAAIVEEAGPVLSDFLRKVFCKDEASKKLCALVIGHKLDSPGVVNKSMNMSEFEFNEKLALLIEKKVKNTKIRTVYRSAYEHLPGEIDALEPDFVVCLHGNAFDGRASGSEVLFYHKSDSSKSLAEILLKRLVEYLKLPNRGVKPATVEDEGGYVLCFTTAPCMIAKPFFIDNDQDLAHTLENLEGLAAAYAAAFDEISKTLTGEAEASLYVI